METAPDNTTSHILVVEDDKQLVTMIRELLLESGEPYAVDTATTLAEGLEHCRRRRYDLLLLDLNLPDSQGLATLERFQAGDPELCILLNSGLDDEETALQAVQKGAQDYLVKGRTPPRALLRSVRYALERKRTLDDLRATHARLLQQEKMASIGQLAAGVAHEINNPMGFIISNLGTLEKYTARIRDYLAAVDKAVAATGNEEAAAALAEERRRLKIDFVLTDLADLIHESLDGAQRVTGIVKNLKSFSHVDDMALVRADLRECLDSTLNIVWNELKYKTKVVKEYEEVPPLECYPQQLNQVFMNLLVNAGQSIDQDGTITIRLQEENDWVVVEVSDTGSGIPPEIQARIFEPFFTTKEVGKGTGLGLSIAYDIVTKKHGGELLVTSEPGCGTTFTVRLPRERAAAR